MLAIVLSFLFMTVEVIGGYIANSIAIYSDAAHLLTDVAGFLIALIATITSRQKGSRHLTFGYVRAEVLGALFSVLSLWIITVILFYEAFRRSIGWFNGHGEKVDGFFMFIVACFGILVNLSLGYLFQDEHGGALHPGHSHDHDHGNCTDSHDHKPVTTKATEITPLIANSNKTDHGHEHKHQHKATTEPVDHGHEHKHQQKTTTEPAPFAFIKQHDHDHNHKCTNDNHEHDHDHKPSNDSHKHDHGHKPSSDSHKHDHGHSDHDDLESYHHEKHDDHAAASHHGHGHGGDVNIEAAYMHVITDLIQSVGVAIAGAVLWRYPSFQIIDPLCTFVFGYVALSATIPLTKKIVMILFEGVPSNVRYGDSIVQLRLMFRCYDDAIGS